MNYVFSIQLPTNMHITDKIKITGIIFSPLIYSNNIITRLSQDVKRTFGELIWR